MRVKSAATMEKIPYLVKQHNQLVCCVKFLIKTIVYLLNPRSL